MNILLTKEQENYCGKFGKIVLNACPGSGKTTTVAHKLHFLTKDWHKNHCGVLCLSFTNVAKNEIFDKYREIAGFSLSFPHKILTIDSFVNTHITLPFAHKIKNIGKRYRIIDDMKFLDKICSESFLAKHYGQFVHKYNPSEIDYSIDGSICWKGKDKSDDAKFVSYGKAVKKFQFNMGLLKPSDSTFMAYHILQRIPRLSNYLATKYPHLIIDEAQDTSEIQHSIIDLLYNGGLKNIDLVGDPYQCLYEWRNASPRIFIEKFDDKENWFGMSLSQNRRSTKTIVDAFSKLRRMEDRNVVSINHTNDDLPIHIIKYDPLDYSKALHKYEQFCIKKDLTKNTVLVRGNTLKNSLLGRDNEYFPWEKTSIAFQIIFSKMLFKSNKTKDAINIVRKIIITLKNPDYSFAEIKDKEEELKADNTSNGLIFSILKNLPDFNLSVNIWTDTTQKFFKDMLGLDTAPNFKIKSRNISKGKNLFNKKTLDNPMNQYFNIHTTSNNLSVQTIHDVKGMTFDSVFLILSGDSKGQNISLSNFKLKHNELPNEKQRLIYVAISRPKYLLCLGAPNYIENNELEKIFSKNIIFL